MDFIHDDFLLQSETARRLYHTYAAAEPILDYHSHLPAAEIAADRKFNDLYEIWLEGDHYKWRAMRANGISERYCTGDAPPYEKYLAWARTLPFTLRNPLYHWTHLELKRYFGIGELLDESSAKSIWDRANATLQSSGLTAQGILRKFGVRAVCTSDDPCDDLAHHQAVASSCREFRVYPTFRPDAALLIQASDVFRTWLGALEKASNKNVESLQDFMEALKQRHDAFHARGCRLSDHGLSYCYAAPGTEREASSIFAKARAGSSITGAEHEKFGAFMMLFFGRLDAEKGWTKQLHLGAVRNANTRKHREIGPNTGFDNIGDWNQISAFCSYLDALDRENALPKTIVYNSNPADNYAFATAIGSFQDGAIAGKIQMGSGWWFLDQKEGIEWQLNALSNTGLLSRFVGMITDSRSFMSFPRHEYFRRILCNVIGREAESGELPNDEQLLGEFIRNLCFENARRYLGLALPNEPQESQKPGS
ncbi:MAG TPA: glucuronate isomerase [Candidatus Acidoferrales bacterium]|jgi:glucuronate isomerase|nr:glucuronate isomerase [Candidatus Acidoferrales bacterium]